MRVEGHESFDDFVAARLPSLLRFATMLCVDPGLAEDIVQDVLLKCLIAGRRWLHSNIQTRMCAE